MATYTTNINLKKPAQSDKIRIADINNNMDDIDAAFGAIGNDSVATQIGNIQGALAIVAVGDSHAAVTAGQFVYVRSHETLDAGLYVASANIAQNAALSLSNLTADSSGGLNALNSKIATQTGDWFFGAVSRIAGQAVVDCFIPMDNITLNKLTPNVNKVAYFGINGGVNLTSNITSVAKLRNGLQININNASDLITYVGYTLLLNYTLDS